MIPTCTYWYRGCHVCIIPPPLTQTQIPLLHFWRDLFSPVSLLQAVWVCVSSSVASIALNNLCRKTLVPIKRSLFIIIIIGCILTTADYCMTLTFSSTSSGAAIMESCCHLSNFGEVIFRSFIMCTYMRDIYCMYATKDCACIPYCGWFHRIVEIHTVQLGYPPPLQHSDAGRNLFQGVVHWSRRKYNLASHQIHRHPLEPGTCRWGSLVSSFHQLKRVFHILYIGKFTKLMYSLR